MKPSVIVVVGSLHYDIMVKAPRMPITGETLVGQKWYAKFGGKGGNQALAVKRDGGEVRFFGAIGKDSFGDFLLQHLAENKISSEYVDCLDDVGSGMSVAHIDGDGDYAAVIVSGANKQMDVEKLNQESLWSNAKLLLLQNEVSGYVNLQAARRANEAGLTICLNAAPARTLSPEFCALIDVLVVNAIEAEFLTGISIENLKDAANAATKLSEQFAQVVVTAGGKGAVVAQGSQRLKSIEPIVVEVVSTHGAGDLFTGILCTRLASGSDLFSAAQAANAAAARHVALFES